jgi:hypothetical protein
VIEAGHWYDVQLQVRGHDTWCSVDGQTELLYRDGAFGHGRFGFGTMSTEVRFRNIRVTSADGEEIWKGLPSLP